MYRLMCCRPYIELRLYRIINPDIFCIGPDIYLFMSMLIKIRLNVTSSNVSSKMKEVVNSSLFLRVCYKMTPLIDKWGKWDLNSGIINILRNIPPVKVRNITN